MSAYGKDSRIGELRANEFGLHLYTYGTDAWKAQLIDYRSTNAAEPVAWENADPLAWDVLIQRLVRVARELRTDWVSGVPA